MSNPQQQLARYLLTTFLIFFALSSCALATYISGSTSRALLAKTECTVDFAHQNYTIITSQCKGPNYEAGPCCAAFREFSCPFSKEINDEKSGCASTMFSYINALGKYPPALFSSLCEEGKQGQYCRGFNSAKKSSATRNNGSASVAMAMMLSASFLMLLCHVF